MDGHLLSADRGGRDGAIVIPAVGTNKPSGHYVSMKSFLGGFQLQCSGGFKTEYAFDVPRAGKYALAARVVTLQEGQKFLISAIDGKAPAEIAVPYTIGKWEPTKPVLATLWAGPWRIS